MYDISLKLSQSQWLRGLRHEVFARSNSAVMDSNPSEGMDICGRVYPVYVVLYIGSALATGLSLGQGALPSVQNNYETEEKVRVQQGL
jgi:hypothetical protein